MNALTPRKVVVIGASGGIGTAFMDNAHERYSGAEIIGLSRSGDGFDFTNEASVSETAGLIGGDLDLIIVATGLLHTEEFGPEKSLRNLDAEVLAKVYAVNTIGPALVMKHFLPLMAKDRKSVFAALSARVGSISDNRIGGWYGYRAAKAALNQMLRTASIEHRRRWKESVIIGLHPGTVDTPLSEPFQRNVPEGKLFTPDHATNAMLDVIDGLDLDDSGHVFAYDGSRIPT